MEQKVFLVTFREVHISTRQVRAGTIREAFDKAKNIANEIYVEYSHTLSDGIKIAMFLDQSGLSAELKIEDYNQLSDTDKDKPR